MFSFIIFLNLMDMIHDFVYSPDVAKGIDDLIDGFKRALDSILKDGY